MIPASAEYELYEGINVGARPAVRISFLPYFWPNGVDDTGDFLHVAYVSPNRLQADYEGFSGGYWVSPVLASSLEISETPVVVTWDWNYPGFDVILYYRTADDETLLAAEDWVVMSNGASLNLFDYYQFKLEAEGYRCWAVDDPGDADDWTAYAVDSSPDTYLSYAADTHVTSDSNCYIEDAQVEGEFTVVADIEQAGSLTVEAPESFDDLVAGDYSGLSLNNRQVDELGNPAPRYSPNKSSFLFAGQDWYDMQIKVEMGWSRGAWFQSGFLEDEFFEESFVDFVTVFLGRIKNWGPVNRAVAEPTSVEIYAKDFIMDCLQKRIALPLTDGTPQPVTYGEFLCQAEEIVGWTPGDPFRTALFESADFSELDIVVEAGGGALSFVTPGLSGTYALRASINGANQSAYGQMNFITWNEIFVTGSIRFKTVPASPVNCNLMFMQAEVFGLVNFALYVDNTGMVFSTLGGQSNFNVLAYLDVPIPFELWFNAGSPGNNRLWFNGDEIITHSGTSPGVGINFRFGAIAGAAAETWDIDFDDIRVYPHYYNNAYVVYGGPFDAIGSVYIDNLGQPDTQTTTRESVDYTQTVTRYPEWGIVQFSSTDPEFEVSGDVMVRVVEHAGGRHALEIIELLLAQAGVDSYIDATTLAAAYVTCPADIIHARFDGQGERNPLGMRDTASTGITIADCLKEICSRMMYWLFVDHGVIKIIPYTDIPPASPVMALTSSNLRSAVQTIDLEDINSYVTAVYGWYTRNKTLFYMAGDQAAGSRGTGLDYTWDSPVACEELSTVKAKTDLLFKFLSAKDQIEVAMNLSGARLELMEVVSLSDEILTDAPINYFVTRKDVGLDPGSREVNLQLTRYLGE